MEDARKRLAGLKKPSKALFSNPPTPIENFAEKSSQNMVIGANYKSHK